MGQEVLIWTVTAGLCLPGFVVGFGAGKRRAVWVGGHPWPRLCPCPPQRSSSPGEEQGSLLLQYSTAQPPGLCVKGRLGWVLSFIHPSMFLCLFTR